MGEFPTGWHGHTNTRGQPIDAEGRVLMTPTTIRRPELVSSAGDAIGAGVLSVTDTEAVLWLHRPSDQRVTIPRAWLGTAPVGSAVVACLAGGAVVGVRDAAGVAGYATVDGVGLEIGAVGWSVRTVP